MHDLCETHNILKVLIQIFRFSALDRSIKLQKIIQYFAFFTLFQNYWDTLQLYG